MIAQEIRVARRFPEITKFDRHAREREVLLQKLESDFKDLKERAKRLA